MLIPFLNPTSVYLLLHSLMKYVIVNSNKLFVEAIQAAIDAVPHIKSSVSVIHTDLRSFLKSYPSGHPTAIVSPANSLAYMGGGFDKAILSELTGDNFPNFNYKTLEKCIQANAARHHGYIVPSTVHVVDLAKLYKTARMDFSSTLASAKNITTLLQVPTMVVPDTTTPQVVFDSMWNVMVEAESDSSLRTVILPALGGGYGGVEAAVIGRVMAGAIGLITMDVPPLARSVAVLLFTRKDHRKLELPDDIAELESYMNSEKIVDYTGDWPMPWDELMEVMKVNK